MAHYDTLLSHLKDLDGGIFIDGGFFRGEVSSYFLERLSPNWQFHAFDINIEESATYAELLSTTYDNFRFYNKGLYIQDGTMPWFRDMRPDLPNGSNLIGKQFGKSQLDFDHVRFIDTIDIGNWIVDTFDKTANIVLKLDVEGIEYEILQYLINTNIIEYIDLLCIEWHPMLNLKNIKLNKEKLPTIINWV